MTNALSPTSFIDSEHPSIMEYAKQHSSPDQSPLENAVQLYYAVRDDFFYNPYHIEIERDKWRASTLLSRSQKKGGHCIDKALLLVACLRSIGIPAKLHFANVRNHIGTSRLEEELGNNLLVFHGYVELWLENKWVKATPAFNKALCDMLNVAPLEFNGREDSIFQEYDHEGGNFMEYVHDYGVFDDLPFELMVAEWKRYYPDFIARKTGEKL